MLDSAASVQYWHMTDRQTDTALWLRLRRICYL